MSLFKILRVTLLFSFVFFSSWISADPDLLKVQDVNKIMKQIFAQHVDKKAMTSEILKNSFKVYVDQFDPDRIYLLESEVTPFFQLDEKEMNRIIAQYQNGEFPEYALLNDVIQKAITRAREIRTELERDKASLFQTSKDYKTSGFEDWRDPDLKRHFAKNVDELKERMKHDLLTFIAQERKRYGESQVNRYEDQTLALYERKKRILENQYIYENDLAAPLSPADKENLFTMHILKSLASSLDSHTTFLNPTEAFDMKVRLEKEFLGIGVVLKQIPEGGYVITRVLDGSTAAKSGLIKVYDKLIDIDGKPISNESYDKVMELLRGKNGTKISLVVQRDVEEGNKKINKTFNVQLKREPIVIHDDRVDYTYETFGNGIIGIITLHSFYQSEGGISSEKDLLEAIKNLDKKGNLRGIILDLRENSGGFLSQAVKVAGLFITNGIVVISKYFNGEEHFYRDMDGKTYYDGPLVILTSKATASAAEIVAQALQDYGVALIVGDEHTYGKGTIQSQTVTENQSASLFKVTVGKYYTVSGKTPQMQGVKADIVVPSQFAYENIGEEYLEFALQQDNIPSAYVDTLKDIDPNLRSWYLRYYTPTLQHQKNNWKDILTVLKKNSEYRIAHNKSYQNFLKNNQVSDQRHEASQDMQMHEAVNIMKDFIILQARNREAHLVEHRSGPSGVGSGSVDTVTK